MDTQIPIRIELLPDLLIIIPQSFHIKSNTDWFHFLDYSNMTIVQKSTLVDKCDYQSYLQSALSFSRYGDFSTNPEDDWLIPFGENSLHPTVSKLGFSSEIEYRKSIKATLSVLYDKDHSSFRFTKTKKIKFDRWDTISNSAVTFSQSDTAGINSFFWSWLQENMKKR